MRRFSQMILLVWLGAASASSAWAEASNMRGLTVPPYPFGCEYIEGTILYDADNYRAGSATHGTTTLKCGKSFFVLLEKLVSRDGTKPISKIVDQLLLPSLGPSQEIMNSLICSSTQSSNSTMAIGEFSIQPDKSLLSKNIVISWTFELDRDRIVVVPSESVECSVDAVD